MCSLYKSRFLNYTFIFANFWAYIHYKSFSVELTLQNTTFVYCNNTQRLKLYPLFMYVRNLCAFLHPFLLCLCIFQTVSLTVLLPCGTICLMRLPLLKRLRLWIRQAFLQYVQNWPFRRNADGKSIFLKQFIVTYYTGLKTCNSLIFMSTF